jgi:uncharacterized protein
MVFRRARFLAVVAQALAFFAFFYVAFWLCASLLRPMLGVILSAGVSSLLSAMFASALAMGWFHSLPWLDVGARFKNTSLPNFARGAALGFVAAAITLLLPMALGLNHWQPDPKFPASLAGSLFVLFSSVGVAFGEEMAFRGYPLQVLCRKIHPALSVILLATLFGLMHAENTGATKISVANTIGWGIVLGFALWRSQDLYFPAGIHFAWNSGCALLGVPVSGFTMGTTGQKLVWSIDANWSGGNYGPEGGWICTLVIPALLFAIWKWPVPQGGLALVQKKEDL